MKPSFQRADAPSRHAPLLARLALGMMLSLLTLGACAAWDVQQLMETLAQTKSARSSFVEKKYIAILDKPVESSGDLTYTAPDILEKRTLKPKAETMTIRGDELFIERGQQKHRLQLQAYPEVAAFIDSIRGTLSGDRKSLERSYRLSLEGSAERWTLRLFPLNEKMAATIQRISMTGVREEIRSIEINQADGDHSVMTIDKLPPQ